MELKIYKNAGIRDVQKQFTRFFPFLKLEFFVYALAPAKPGIADAPYYGLYVAETSESFKEGVVEFSPNTRVIDLEMQFLEKLGLNVKIFRRAGDSWMDTTETSHLTLGKQNNMGASLFRPIKINANTLFL